MSNSDLPSLNIAATWQSGSGTTHAAVPGQSGSGGSETQNFCYDEQNRLLWGGNGGTQPGAGNGTCGSGTLSNTLSGAGYTNAFAYTHLGQLWQGPLNGTGAAQQYLYCDSTHPHQLSGLYPVGTTCASRSGAVYSASYDAWGNLTSRTTGGTTATLSYDVLDHLTQWNAGSTSQEYYAYDAGSNRTLRRSTTGSGTTITVYAFGLEEHLYGASGTNTGNTYYYTLGGRLIGAASGTGTLSTQFFLTDALGSVLATFNAIAGTAVLLGNQVYGPYGKQRYSQGAMGTAKGFTGQYGDVTGLDYYNARYYDPVVGLFVSADTAQGNVQGVNPYAYVAGNPETMNDPTGHWLEFLAAAVVAVAAAVVVVTAAPAIAAVGMGVLAGMTMGALGTIAQQVQSGNPMTDLNQTLDTAGGNMLWGGLWGGIGSGVGAGIGVLADMAGGASFASALNAPSALDVVTEAAAGATGSGSNLWYTNPWTPPNPTVENHAQEHASCGSQFTCTPKPAGCPSDPNQNCVPKSTPTPAPTSKSAPVDHTPQSLPPPPPVLPSAPTRIPQTNPGNAGKPAPSYRGGGSTSGGSSSGSAASYYTVVSGDSLWAIAARFYGSGFQWQRLYQANIGVIGADPNLIYPGERLAIR